MNKWKILLIFFGVMVFSSPANAFEGSLRCQHEIIRLGDSPEEVEDLCGPPFFVDDTEEQVIVRTYVKRPAATDNHSRKRRKNIHKESSSPSLDDNFELINERSSIVNIEQWTYNLGSHSFVRFLTFKNDQLVSIKIGSYGVDEPSRKLNVHLGDSKGLVQMKWGLAGDIKRNVEYDTQVSGRQVGDYLYMEETSRPIVNETWIYDFGPEEYLQQLVFTNNSLVKMEKLRRKGSLRKNDDKGKGGQGDGDPRRF